jgi:hypothetical protein
MRKKIKGENVNLLENFGRIYGNSPSIALSNASMEPGL